MDPYATSHISNAALRHEVRTGAANDCRSTAVLLSRLGEFDARGLYREDGYPSMHSYCVQELHFCEGTASWRIYAARAARRFPVLFDAVADGRLHLTAVVMLRKYLTSGNVDDLVVAATHKSRAGIELLIAQRFPRSDLPERLVALPAPCSRPASSPVSEHWPANAGTAGSPTAPTPPADPEYWLANTGATGLTAPTPPADPAYWLANTGATGPTAPTSAADPSCWLANAGATGPTAPTPAADPSYWPANAPASASRPKLVPLSPGRFGLQVTLDQEACDLLKEAQALMSHQIPANEIAPVLKCALRLLVEQQKKRRFAATERPGQGTPRSPEKNGDATRRYIPAEVKRTVRARDEGRCTFVSESGKRCPARSLLQYDHVEPVARGGKSTVENVRLLCAAHNAHEAERAFGVEFMEEKRRLAALTPRGMRP